MLTPSGFPAWCWLQARPKCWLLRSYLLFFRLFQFCSCCPASILVSEQTSICLKHPTVNPELEKKISPQKKKSLSIVFSPPAGYLCHFSTWSKKVAIQLCFPIQKKKVTHANPSAPRPKTEFESQQESPMGSGHREPPTPTCYRRRSHHVASCFTGSIELRSAPLSTADSDSR